MRSALYTLSWITIAMAIATVCVISYWMIYPYEILTFGKMNGKLGDLIVKNGSYIHLNQDFCKTNNYPSTVSRRFVDGFIYQVPPFIANRPIGCHKTVEFVYVPKALPTGKYHIEDTITFKVNPLREITYTVVTDEFEVYK